jgi:hypothetical protein
MRQGERERGREGGGSEGGTREAPAIVKVWLRGKGRKICRGVRGREGREEGRDGGSEVQGGRGAGGATSILARCSMRDSTPPRDVARRKTLHFAAKSMAACRPP